MAACEGALVVFGPSLMLTVTIEQDPAGEPELHIHAGGQGLWVARMAASLGADMTLCSALGGVRLLKISEEALAHEGLARAGEGALSHAIAELHRRGAENVIISRAEAGAVALIDDALLQIVGPRLTPADHHGAGDSTTAAAAVGIAERLVDHVEILPLCNGSRRG